MGSETGLSRQPPWRWSPHQKENQVSPHAYTHRWALRTPQHQECSAPKPFLTAQPVPSWLKALLASPGELRRGGGQKQASQAFLLHSRGHALLPPCLSPAINYFRLAKSGLLLSCLQPPARPRPGPASGNPQHPQSPDGSGQVGWRKPVSLLGHHL